MTLVVAESSKFDDSVPICNDVPTYCYKKEYISDFIKRDGVIISISLLALSILSLTVSIIKANLIFSVISFIPLIYVVVEIAKTMLGHNLSRYCPSSTFTRYTRDDNSFYDCHNYSASLK